ncbi:four helix bundle protein [Dokdonia sp.]|uniref:four helix bundle protein n=1 Tax=Dokdonia sp. TaxID=2024995 RepID=UPI0032642E2B
MARHNFRNLKIWKDGISFVTLNYKLTKTFPKTELYNITSQMNRSALSIPSNIAEGTAKSTDKHFKTYLETSLGSAYEWETQLEIANIQGYVTDTDYKELIDRIHQIQRMIGAFIDRLDS